MEYEDRRMRLGDVDSLRREITNIEQIKEKAKRYYDENKPKLSLIHKAYYQKNKSEIQYHGKEYHNQIRQEFLLKYKKGKCCANCGWKEHPEILQFHHKDKEMKKFTIGNLSATKRRSPEFEAEVKKCILLCPNCHSLLHIKHGGFK